MISTSTLSLKLKNQTFIKKLVEKSLIEPLRKPLKKLVKNLFNFLFNFYKFFLRPHLGYSCIYQPTCSAYAKEAFQEHNTIKAFFISAFRILRCHPFGRGGYDPVPTRQELKHG